MKLDIEGSEYLVLPDLLLSGAFCKFDFIFGETHPRFAPLDFEGHAISLKNQTEAETFETALKTLMISSRVCSARFLWIDDEKYHMDGVPLP